ncbi:hypothetical protein A9K55_003432 [Cordyceps militaris]|uniref:Rhodopsin domain-containing protein n=1 Tax=Cordyceps militaris TaxID=73501 RepID=A0A2H4S7L0_CORMI|nr:hypothetical protein A9K55_003432 [Cordyceps militaris]
MPAFRHAYLGAVSARHDETRGMAAMLPRAAAAQDTFQVEAWALLATALTVTALRTGLRISTLGIRQLRWDDYLVCVGALFYVAETILAYCVGKIAHGLANSTMTDEHRASLSPDDDEYRLRVIGSQIQIAGWTTYGTLLWVYKTCMLIFYTRLTSGLHKSYKRQIIFGFALLGSTYIILAATIFLSCRPFHKYWQIYPDPGNSCQPALSIQIIWTALALNASTDFYLMSIPVPMLWKSGLKLSKKIASTILFTSGLFIIVCALLRSVMITVVIDTKFSLRQDPVNGPQAAGAWSVRESFVATVVTNMPIVFPRLKLLFDRHVAPMLSLRSSKSGGHSATGFRTIGGGDGQGGDGGARRFRRHPPQSVNPLPTTKLTTVTTTLTVTESAEQLVEDEGIELQSGGKSPAPSDSAGATGPPQATGARAAARDTEAAAAGCSQRTGRGP